MVKIATLQLSGCGGCHIALLDALNNLPELISKDILEIKYSHMLMDKKTLSEEVDLLIVEGGVSTTDEEAMLKQCAMFARKIFALGACAGLRGVLTQGNFMLKEKLLKEYFDENKIPGDDLPEHFEFAHGIDVIVNVDYYHNSCPPDADELRDDIAAILRGKEPRFSIKSVCDECPRKRNKDPEKAQDTATMKRLIEVIPDEEKCFVDQNILCLGHATRAGCNAKCPRAGAPCYGCFGSIYVGDRALAPSDLTYQKKLAKEGEI